MSRGTGVAFIVLGLFLILVPWVIFPVCGVGRYAPADGTIAGVHACHGTLKAETVLGAVAIVAGLVPLFWPGRRVLLFSSIAVLFVAVFAVLFPAVITGVCKVPTMPCRLGTLPALVITGVLTGMAGLAGIIMSRKME